MKSFESNLSWYLSGYETHVKNKQNTNICTPARFYSLFTLVDQIKRKFGFLFFKMRF